MNIDAEMRAFGNAVARSRAGLKTLVLVDEKESELFKRGALDERIKFTLLWHRFTIYMSCGERHAAVEVFRHATARKVSIDSKVDFACLALAWAKRIGLVHSRRLYVIASCLPLTDIVNKHLRLSFENELELVRARVLRNE